MLRFSNLKAYASTDSLNQECVDERFDYVARETAPYVEWLGIQENPYGGGWAAGKDYGSKLRKILADLKSGHKDRVLRLICIIFLNCCK
mgnify:FL=1